MATRHSSLSALVLSLLILLTLTESRVQRSDLEEDLEMLRSSESKFHMKRLIRIITFLASRRFNRQVEMAAEGPSHGQTGQNRPAVSRPGTDVWNDRYLEISPSPFLASAFKHKRKNSRKNSNSEGEHLNPTDFNSAVKIGREDYAPPKGVTDPTENKGRKKKDLFQGDIAHSERESRNMIINKNDMWPQGEIPYEIDSGFNSNERATIASAVLEFERNTCIRVRPLGPRDNASDGFVRIIKGNGCYSSVGRQPSPGQDLSLGNGCIYPGVVVHEFMHALGFWHEQSRPDRDQYVRINYNNIQFGKENNFKKYNRHEAQILDTPYDIGSVMHYGPYAFAKNNKRPTISALRQSSATMGQREGLSREDINKINKLYGCKDVTAPPTPTVQECTDRNKYCKEWARTGECTKNPLYMKIFCAKSCKTCSKESCEDLHKNCKIWAENDECTKTPFYMSLYCKQSCGLCDGETTTNCNNVNRYCGYWADQGECEKNPAYMTLYCKQSCGLCDGVTTTNCNNFSRHCEYWAEQHECEQNPDYMTVDCRKACGLC